MLHNYYEPTMVFDLPALHSQYVDKIAQYIHLLKFVLDNPRNLALQVGCIIEMQLLVYKKPFTEGISALCRKIFIFKGLLNTIFQFLYDNELIIEDAFLKWKAVANTGEEAMGKQEAIEQAVPFFNWLDQSVEGTEREDKGVLVVDNEELFAALGNSNLWRSASAPLVE